MTNKLLASALAIYFVVLGAGCNSDQKHAERFVENWRVLYNSHDLVGFTALYAPTGTFHVPPAAFYATSPVQLRSFLDAIWRQAPDTRLTAVRSTIAQADRIAFAFEMTTTPPTGKLPQTTYGAVFMRLDSGLIKEQSLFLSR